VNLKNNEQEASEALTARLSRIRNKVLVLSGKGGVGKSTVAVNLATQLADAGYYVGLLDVDLHGPSVPTLLSLDGQRLGVEADGSIAPIQLSERLKVVSIGLLLERDTDAVIWRGPRKYGAIQQFLKDVLWGDLDYLVVDCPPGTGDEPLAVAQLIGPQARAILVTTPQDVAVNDVRRSVSFCRTLKLPIAGLIENMSGLVCPHCNKIVDVFKSGGGEQLALDMAVAFLGRIPLDPNVTVSGDRGQPFVQNAADSAAAVAFSNIVKQLTRSESNQPQEQTKETSTMKIAIPTVQGKLCMHFGHCEQFALVSVEDQTITGTDMLTPPPHEPGVLPVWLHEQGANLIISGGMGSRAKDLFAQNEIDVIVGAPVEAPEVVVKAYLAGTLKTGANTCDH
jgi:Mrp family chromosome partitioning ATPase/predicted Fe-Mo cluster-binding NifX family protein